MLSFFRGLLTRCEPMLSKADAIVLRVFDRPFLLGLCLIYPFYALALLIGTGLPPSKAMWFAARSLLPLIPMGFAVRWLITAHLRKARPVWQVFLHGGLATLFSLLWYMTLLVTINVRSGWQNEGFDIRPFGEGASVWQMFQGVTVYALIVALTLLHTYSQNASKIESVEDGTPKAPPGHILVKREDGAVSVPVRDIARVSGAGNYSEIFIVGDKSILSKTRLTEFEALLAGHDFIRAHRSHLINIDHVREMEPAGNGRITIHLTSATSIVSSRQGARLLRSRVH